MYFLILGIVLILLKWQDVAPVVGWSWWWVLSPLLLAVLWWAWADRSGLTRRRAEARDAKRQKELRDRRIGRLRNKP